MKQVKSIKVGKSFGLCSILTLIFAISKVFQIGLASKWSWWWVFSPCWIPTGLVIGILTVIGLTILFLKGLLAVITKIYRKKRKVNPFDQKLAKFHSKSPRRGNISEWPK